MPRKHKFDLEVSAGKTADGALHLAVRARWRSVAVLTLVGLLTAGLADDVVGLAAGFSALLR